MREVTYLETPPQAVNRRDGRVRRLAPLYGYGASKTGILGQLDVRRGGSGVARQNHPVLANDGVTGGRARAECREEFLKGARGHSAGAATGDGSRLVKPFAAD